MLPRFLLLGAVSLVLVSARPSAAVEASPPQGMSLYVYDVGFTLVNELRRITLARGENEIVIRTLPARLDPDTASLTVLGSGAALDMKEQRFEYDLADAQSLFDRYLGRTILLRTPEREARGTLLSAPARAGAGGSSPLVLAPADSADLQSFAAERLSDVTFPGAMKNAFVEPTLLWSVTAAQEGPQNARLAYVTGGFSWDAAYEILLHPDGRTAHFSSRVSLRNESGGAFEKARVKLIATAKGTVAANAAAGQRARADAVTATRYGYGRSEPTLDQSVAGLSPEHTYELSQPLSIAHGETKYFQFAIQHELPVSRFYVYDGVKFDRFPRNRRNDWNYGTEYQTAVNAHLEFNNAKDAGLGIDLPAGHVRVYQQRDNDHVDYLGEDTIGASAPGEPGHVLLGPARGLQGERERIGYTEIRPLHEYEETFEIRLSNLTAEPVEIRVVEHLYRWPDYEIVKADSEYKPTDPQTIEFRPTLKPGGKKTIKYTVRYRW